MSFILRRRNVDLRNWQKVKRLPRNMLKDYKKLVGEPAFQESQQIVPFEFGNLMLSGTYRETQKGFTIRYGLPYATDQHENTGYQHPGKDTKTFDIARASQGTAKYVSAPVNDATKAFLRFFRI